MRKFILKFRYYLALLIILLTFTSINTSTTQLKSTDGMYTTTSSTGGEWVFGTR